MKFKLDECHRNVPDSKLITDLRRVALQLNKKTVTISEYNEKGKYHSCTVTRRFGGWLKALRKAGLKKTRNFGITEEELIEDLKRVAKKLNKKAVTRIEYNTYGNFSASTLKKKFSTWFKALEKAGLSKTRNYGVTEDDYFRNIEAIWVKLGRQPKYGEMQKPFSKYSASAYEHRFGTWRKALEAFIKYINVEENTKMDDHEAEIMGKPDSSNEIVYKHKTKRNVSWRLRFVVMRRDSFKCRICGKSPASDSNITLAVDHIKAWSKGGETIFENLQTLCSKCNIGKSNLDLAADD